ncbi:MULTISPECIES: AtpZ/AtpI family protein [unclassified Desulfovibrio]|uniref:AtpZ/AtpI family protein n=1 Tax=unclassified Desulfovibrio TaxID=2593640 RepID=UPI000F5EA430|nr:MULTISPECIES: AtpZ/AtpI family protein [unclassified Desulfovibrio]RRD69329.1 AtpZ/AtpI family protein [Desulfovibrio sp. OH1209_COT-279]RRD86044.1 AtpZ/AtpI family protein [Desulfovibrio sp. OH1186_COT-070]
MSFRDFLSQQKSGLEAMANTGVIGLHLVSGPLVGFAIGYGLDSWLRTGPWCKLIFLFVGIGAGFLNVYRDTQALLRKMAARDARRGVPAGAEQSMESRTRSEKHDPQP